MNATSAYLLKASSYRDLHTSYWANYAVAYTASLRGETENYGIEGFTQTADEFTQDIVNTVRLSETYYISPNMNAMVTAAAESWEDDEVVGAEDFPSDHGWLYIPGGVVTIDSRGAMNWTSVITWARSGSKVAVSLWADKRHDSPQIRNTPGWDKLLQLSPWHISYIELGRPMESSYRFAAAIPPEVSSGIRWYDTPTGMAMSFPDGWSIDSQEVVHGPEPTLTWLVTALRIMQQPLVDAKRVGLPAAVRKSEMSYPRRLKNTAVTVIELRRRVGEYDTETGRQYSHRFLRRGHWRRQWIGSDKDGTRRQARIWIHATVVGPEDKPLVLRDHVNALRR